MYVRPLLCLALAFMLGIVSERLAGGMSRTVIVCFALAALSLLALLAFGVKSRSRLTVLAVPAILFLIFGAWAARFQLLPTPLSQEAKSLLEQPATYIAEISAPMEFYPDKVRLPLRLTAVLADNRQFPLDLGVLLTLSTKNGGPPATSWLPGDRLLLRVALKPFRSFKNPGAFDYVRYQAGKGFQAQAYVRDEHYLVKILPEDLGIFPISAMYSMRRGIEQFRQEALHWLRRTLDPDSAAFYASLVLGYQQFMDRRWQDLINRTGLNHLLSISGLHLGLVSLFVFQLVRILVRSLHPAILNRVSDKQIAVWPALGCAIVYAFLAGFGVPPIWRSVLMLAVCFGASFWYRSTDALTVLAFAALFILIADPGSFWQISFQLTFACVLAIVLVNPRFRNISVARLFPSLKPGSAAAWAISQFEDALRLSVAVNILVLPLAVFYFNGFSLAGFIANIILVPYVGFLILPWGLISVAAFAVNEAFAYPFAIAAQGLLWLCLRLIEFFGGFSWSYFWTGSMPVFWLVLIYTVLGLLFLPLQRKTRYAGIVVLIPVVLGVTIWSSYAKAKERQTLRADIIDIGQGTATLIRFPSGETMLVDGGGFPDDSFDVGRGVLAPFLWHEGIRKLDHVVLSHDHPDHRNGLRFILSNFDTGCFRTAGSEDAPDGKNRHLSLEQIAARRHIRICSFPELFNELRIGDARIRLLHPAADFNRAETADLNDSSLVLEIQFGDTTLILPGDIGSRIENSIIPALDKNRRALLVAAHHGSEHSNSEELLDAMRPEAVLFSCGFENRYGFPAQAVIKRCADRKIPMYRTDLHGAIHASSDGRQWTITTEADKDTSNANVLFGRPSR